MQLPETKTRAAKGFSRLESGMFADDGGVYLAVGATFLYAVRSAKVDEERLIRNLDWLSANGCQYIRVLLMVGSKPYWPFEINPRSWDAYHRVMELTWERHMRTQPVIFTDAQVMMPDGDDRKSFVVEVAQFCNERREMVQFIEVVNEAEHSGISMDELTRYRELLQTSTEIPFAASSPAGSQYSIGDDLEDYEGVMIPEHIGMAYCFHSFAGVKGQRKNHCVTICDDAVTRRPANRQFGCPSELNFEDVLGGAEMLKKCCTKGWKDAQLPSA